MVRDTWRPPEGAVFSWVNGGPGRPGGAVVRGEDGLAVVLEGTNEHGVVIDELGDAVLAEPWRLATEALLAQRDSLRESIARAVEAV